MNNKKMLGLIFTFILCLFCLVNVKAYSATTLEKEDKVCVASYAKNPIFADRYNEKKDYVYIHTWLKEDGKDPVPAYDWNNKPAMEYVETIEKGNPGEVDIFCYTVREKNNGNNWLLFASHLGKQTKDLHYLGDGLVYVIGSSGCSNGNCDGSWRVYDKSDLNEKLTIADGLDPSDYKISSYQKLLNILDADRGPRYLATKNFAQDYEAFVINLDTQGNFVSYYEDVVNNLTTTLNNLVPRNIVVESAIGGVVSYTYEKDSNTKMKFVSTEDSGYELLSLKVFNNEGIELKDLINDPDPFTYEYNDEDLIISPSYGLKKFVISFTVGEKGKIYDLETENDEEITSPVTVEYGKDKTLKIVANPGYNVETVTVDGADYDFSDDELTIKKVEKDVHVEVSFTLKSYTIKVIKEDGETEYTILHGTSYNELLNKLSLEKYGYTFKELKDKDGNSLDNTYVVDGDDELTPIYERKSYKISFVVGTDGKIYDLSDNEITSPVTVKYEDNYTLKIIANEGYDVKEVIVDGVSYKLTDGKVEIKNVQKDIEVVVNFKLKEYTITVDGTEYKVARGTSYEDLIKQINITKKGYLFKGIKDSNGKLLDENYVVDGDDKLEIIFEKDPLVEVPGTGDNIIGYIMIFISALIALSIFFITRKKNCKN